MTNNSIKKIRILYDIVLSCGLIFTGLCLMVACVEIYQLGDHPFSRETVAAAFSGIAIPVYVCLALILGGFILDFVLPCTKTKNAPDKQHALILKRLYNIYDTDKMSPDLKKAAALQRKTRRLHWTVTGILLAVGSIIFFSYAINPANFHSAQINESMISAMCVMFPCLAVPFSYGMFSAFHARTSILAEATLIKQAIAAGCPKKAPIERQSTRFVNWLLITRITFFLVGIAILIYGLFTGGTVDVLTKAINICTECVGLG